MSILDPAPLPSLQPFTSPSPAIDSLGLEALVAGGTELSLGMFCLQPWHLSGVTKPLAKDTGEGGLK